MKAKNVDTPSAKPVQDWSEVTAQLDKGDFMSLDNDGPTHFTTWLTTINADGSPHVTAVGAVWDGDTFWFQTADRTLKARNLVREPRCAVSLTLDGSDVVFEGTADKVTDPDDVARIAGSSPRAAVGRLSPTSPARASRPRSMRRASGHHPGSSTASPRVRRRR
jgi:hypothetical protein